MPHCHCGATATGGMCMCAPQQLGAHKGTAGVMDGGVGASTLFLAGTVAYVAVTGLIGSEFGAYFSGYERNVNRKTIAKRNAALGGVLGVGALAVMGVIQDLPKL